MSYLNDLAERRPDLFSASDLLRLTSGKRFQAWADEITVQANEAQRQADTLDGRKKPQRLLTAGGPK